MSVRTSLCGPIYPARVKPQRLFESRMGFDPRPTIQLPLLSESLCHLEQTNYQCQQLPVSLVCCHPLIYPSVSVWISSDKVNLSPPQAEKLMSGVSALRQFITITCLCCISVKWNRALEANSIQREGGCGV